MDEDEPSAKGPRKTDLLTVAQNFHKVGLFVSSKMKNTACAPKILKFADVLSAEATKANLPKPPIPVVERELCKLERVCLQAVIQTLKEMMAEVGSATEKAAQTYFKVRNTTMATVEAELLERWDEMCSTLKTEL